MQKRILPLVALILLVSFILSIGKPESVKPVTYTHSEGVSLGFSNEDEIVKAVRKSLVAKDKSVTVSFSTDGSFIDEIETIVSDLMKNAYYVTDNPEEGDYLKFQCGGYIVSYNQIGDYYYAKIEPDYYTTKTEEREVDEEVDRIIASFNFTDSTTDYEKIKTIRDYLYDNVSYDKVHKNNEYYHLKTTAYAALIYRTAVCQGYSVAFYRLLKECGIDNRIITGYVNYNDKTEYHSWNIVKLNGVYYNVDITWDKELGGTDYFLKSDSTFSDHVRDAEYLTEDFLTEYKMSETDYNLTFLCGSYIISNENALIGLVKNRW